MSPAPFGHVLSSRLYCTPKTLWKLNWFLRDFGYDTELLGRDEVDETQLVGLKGVAKISHIVCLSLIHISADLGTELGEPGSAATVVALGRTEFLT